MTHDTQQPEPQMAELIKAEVKNERGRLLASLSSGQPYSIIRVLSTHLDAGSQGSSNIRQAVVACSWTKTEYTLNEGEHFDFNIRHRLIRVTLVEVFSNRAVVQIHTDADDMFGKVLAPMALKK